MIERKNNLIKIMDVPYFQQTSFYTCGPAALMMVMKYWNSSFELSKKNEYDVWKQSNPFVFFGGTLQYGLSKAASIRGFSSIIYQKGKLSDYYHFPFVIGCIEWILLRNAHQAHTRIYYLKEIFDVLYFALEKNIPPIVFLNLKSISGENVFHWVVVTGIKDGKIYVNDPYVPQGTDTHIKKGFPIDIEIFHQAMETHIGRRFRLPPCVLLVQKKVKNLPFS